VQVLRQLLALQRRQPAMPNRAPRADHPPLDVLVVPGGDGVMTAMEDEALLRWIVDTGAQAQWVTSVCTGALLLHTSGVSKGRRLATHWALEDRLAELGLGPREIASLVRAGELLRLADGVVLLAGADDRAVDLLTGLGADELTLSEVRQALGTTRRVAVPLMEHLGRTGRTVRTDSGAHRLRR